MVKIVSSYSDYDPSVDVEKRVRQMLDAIPSKYLVSLRTIFLTNTAALNRERRKGKIRNRGKKYAVVTGSGLYSYRKKDKAVSIEIYVGEKIKGYLFPKALLVSNHYCKACFSVAMDYSEVRGSTEEPIKVS